MACIDRSWRIDRSPTPFHDLWLKVEIKIPDHNFLQRIGDLLHILILRKTMCKIHYHMSNSFSKFMLIRLPKLNRGCIFATSTDLCSPTKCLCSNIFWLPVSYWNSGVNLAMQKFKYIVTSISLCTLHKGEILVQEYCTW